MTKDLKSRIITYMALHKMTQVEFAALVGTSRQNLLRILKDEDGSVERKMRMQNRERFELILNGVILPTKPICGTINDGKPIQGGLKNEDAEKNT